LSTHSTGALNVSTTQLPSTAQVLINARKFEATLRRSAAAKGKALTPDNITWRNLDGRIPPSEVIGLHVKRPGIADVIRNFSVGFFMTYDDSSVQEALRQLQRDLKL
jgi:hypothetical protein